METLRKADPKTGTFPVTALLCCAALTACQGPDPNYAPVVTNPTYPGAAPVVGVDQTHQNFHRVDGKYQGFAQLLRADGYVVQPFTATFSPEQCPNLFGGDCPYLDTLDQIDTLVISNAQAMISQQEAFVIAVWVASRGGNLMLIADHTPFPPFIAELATFLQIDWRDADSIAFDDFSAVDGTLEPSHPITQGAGPAEVIPSVRSFRGSALQYLGEQPATSLLTFPAGVTYVDPATQVLSAAGLSRGLALEFGAGRVYASTEAAMFTAQVVSLGGFDIPSLCPQGVPLDECMLELCMTSMTEQECLEAAADAPEMMAVVDPNQPAPQDPMPVGMQVTPHNEQFLLNIMHWLDKLL